MKLDLVEFIFRSYMESVSSNLLFANRTLAFESFWNLSREFAIFNLVCINESDNCILNLVLP
jgi:hypothetical protein